MLFPTTEILHYFIFVFIFNFSIQFWNQLNFGSCVVWYDLWLHHEAFTALPISSFFLFSTKILLLIPGPLLAFYSECIGLGVTAQSLLEEKYSMVTLVRNRKDSWTTHSSFPKLRISRFLLWFGQELKLKNNCWLQAVN